MVELDKLGMKLAEVSHELALLEIEEGRVLRRIDAAKGELGKLRAKLQSVRDVRYQLIGRLAYEEEKAEEYPPYQVVDVVATQ